MTGEWVRSEDRGTEGMNRFAASRSFALPVSDQMGFWHLSAFMSVELANRNIAWRDGQWETVVEWQQSAKSMPYLVCQREAEALPSLSSTCFCIPLSLIPHSSGIPRFFHILHFTSLHPLKYPSPQTDSSPSTRAPFVSFPPTHFHVRFPQIFDVHRHSIRFDDL